MDNKFKQELEKNPHEIFKNYGIPLDKNTKLKIYTNKKDIPKNKVPNELALLLPTENQQEQIRLAAINAFKEKTKNDSEDLNDDDLENVAGGANYEDHVAPPDGWDSWGDYWQFVDNGEATTMAIGTTIMAVDGAARLDGSAGDAFQWLLTSTAAASAAYEAGTNEAAGDCAPTPSNLYDLCQEYLIEEMNLSAEQMEANSYPITQGEEEAHYQEVLDNGFEPQEGDYSDEALDQQEQEMNDIAEQEGGAISTEDHYNQNPHDDPSSHQPPQ